ncbi:unnamed protein product [Schistosoma curassoni]|uniref:Uncharacterized protein n=1 Tax=Schistosoma curassoni TaxID=6186 RepID=A0A183JJB4_9TREM|nr:unnamed protein product [Schistosoma curassoni]
MTLTYIKNFRCVLLYHILITNIILFNSIF